MEFFLQIGLVLVCLFYGARKGGVALGLLGGAGLVVLAFIFGIPPGKPPVDVMLTILAVVSASATLQASGGLDVMLQIAERLLRKHPKYISVLAPVVSTSLTMICGTGHVVYTLLPIIYDISITNNIRPERPMAASSVAAQLGIIASPVSVAVGAMVAMLAGYSFHGTELTYTGLLSITIPSTLCGVLAIGLFSWHRGKDLDKDEDFQNFIKTPENRKYVYGEGESLLHKKLPRTSWYAMWIFLGAIALVGILGAFEQLRPYDSMPKPATAAKAPAAPAAPAVTATNATPQAASTTAAPAAQMADAKVTPASTAPVKQADAAPAAKKAPAPKRLSMVLTIQMFMLCAGALILIVTKTSPAAISKNEVFRSGMVAIVAVFGIAWMADTIFGAHIEDLKRLLPPLVEKYPWSYAVALIIISKFVNSQAAALTALVPVALKAGVNPGVIIAFAPACYGYFILPTYPSDLAAINFDRSGTTKIGRYVINHSFILPGAVGVITSCIVGYVLATMKGYL